ncbi:hypothetical protein AB4156_30380 [Cupriavidus sp. 2MCAB6]|uniref:hypothetical protein n=1 Tax=Cupriavidus sp. 2MCAB6 TaxID=3232981 RepID=UPI003F939E5C
MKAKILILIAAMPALMSILYVLYRVFYVRVNHVGITPHYLDLMSMASVLLALLFGANRKGLWFIAWLATLNVLMVVWAIDTYVLVEYEEWIRKGLPGKSVGYGAP